MSEEWRAVKGYKTYYEVSTRGQVRSLDRYVNDKRTGRRLIKGKILTLIKMKSNGYIYVGLCKNGKVRLRQVHSLVLEAFVGPCPKGMVARHFPDRDKSNNRIVNLSWDTPQQNAKDRETHGTQARSFGEDHPGHKFSEKTIKRVRKIYKTTAMSQKKVGRLFGMSQPQVCRIVSGVSRGVK